MTIGYQTVAEFGFVATAELLSRAFADYLVKVEFSAAGFARAMAADSFVPDDSLVVRVDDMPAGAVLMARRGAACRVAGMGFVPEQRFRGVGRSGMERVMADARARGDRRMVLEVIEQNAPAVRLYESLGFRRRRRLVGFAGSAPAGLGDVPEMAAVPVQEVAAAVEREKGVEWPWQISGETIARMAAPATGYHLDGAWLALVDASADLVSIRGVVVEGAGRRAERAARLLRAVMARHPGRSWRMSALLPEEFGDWFAAAGLERQELSQWQMERAP